MTRWPGDLVGPCRSTAFVALVAVLASCSGVSQSPAPLPDGLSVAVLQTRSDIAKRQLEIAVSNHTQESLRVTGARLDTPQFTEPAVWRDSTTISAGRTVNLPVSLGEPECGNDGGDPEVRLEFRLGDADPVTVVAIPDDALDRLPALQAEDCLAVAIGEIAELRIDGPARVVVVAETSVVELDLAIDPTGSGDAFTIDEVIGTTLLAPAVADSGAMLPAVPVGVAVRGYDTGSVLTLTFVPNRCDAHAVAEDKRGTIIPLRVTTDAGASGILSVASPPAVKTALIDYLSQACTSD